MTRGKIAVIGGGEIGSAFTGILLKKGARVSVWDKDPSKSSEGVSLSEAVKGAGTVFFAVPSWCLRDAMSHVSGIVSPESMIILISKGLEEGSGKTALEISEDYFEGNAKVFMGGPMIAEELSSGLPSFGVAASRENDASMLATLLFSGSNFSMTRSSDDHGVELCGILKNLYAIGLGMVDGVGCGSNARGAFVSRAVQEMSLILSSEGCKEETVFGIAGLGDFIATGFGSGSSNRAAGIAIAKRETPKKSEGISSVIPARKRFCLSGKVPLLSAVSDVIIGRLEPKGIIPFI